MLDSSALVGIRMLGLGCGGCNAGVVAFFSWAFHRRMIWYDTTVMDGIDTKWTSTVLVFYGYGMVFVP